MAGRGRVDLVGAGPGDPGLITVKGRELLRQADVVIYDHLVSPRLLEECPAAARRIYAGKEAGKHSRSQAQIHRLLVEHARAGRRVVRLKGGDPVLFGRGGEEAMVLAKAKIPFQIVPGVTSAVAVPAAAGIPVTHRDLSSSVLVITGHEDPSKPARSRAARSQTDRWKQWATAADTLVCLMGVRRLDEIVAKLRANGRTAATPCAVVQWGTVPAQRTVDGTLGTIVQRCRAASIQPPAVLVVGEVVRLRRWLNWFERSPLFGKRIVITRPAGRADALAQRLESLGAETIALPAIELAAAEDRGALTRAIHEIDQIDWVFFTSPEAIQWFRKALVAKRRDLRILQGRHIGAIGPKTAESIEAMGIHVDVVPTTFTQEGMLDGLARRRLAGKRAVILGAEQGRDALERGLAARGLSVERVPIYRTVMPTSLLRRVRGVFAQPIEYVTVTSASCVEHLAQALRSARMGAKVATLPFASIGPATSAAVRQAGARVVVEAKASTVDGLVDAIVATARGSSRRRRRAVGA